jgi:AraC-like DNA-binding protein
VGSGYKTKLLEYCKILQAIQEMEMNDRAAINRAELREVINRLLPHDGVAEPTPDVRLARASQPTERMYGVTEPCLCVIAQGAKEIFIGDGRHVYDPEHYLLATVELPVTGKVIRASATEPYVSFRLELDPALVGSVMVEAGLLGGALQSSDSKAVVVSRLDFGLQDAVLRLVRLLENPLEARMLMPLVKREIVYRLLVGEQGGRLRHLTTQGGHSGRIAQAVDRLRRNFAQPLSIEGLARDLGMSPSGFHHHFKLVTDMSPLQFQKQIRLQEARRLLLGGDLDAASAGYRVGYDDPSHFSRDYKKQFGDSPLRDVERLRGMVTAD